MHSCQSINEDNSSTKQVKSTIGEEDNTNATVGDIIGQKNDGQEKKSIAHLRLNHFAQQPHWLRDNHYLHNNHRAPTESYLVCLKSCFMLHTETINIWTHLLPCFLFIFFIARTIDSSNLTITDKFVIGGFLLGAFLCHFLSSAFHTFICHSERVGRFFQK